MTVKWDKHFLFQCQAFQQSICPCQHSTFHSMWDKGAYSLSETSAVNFGDGVWSHRTPYTGAGRRTLGYWCDAIWRVLTGRGEGCITGHTQTIVCGSKSKILQWIKNKHWYILIFPPFFSNELPSPSWEAGSRARSSVKCRHSSPCSSWPEDSCSTFVFPFLPSRSFKIIYGNT